ncbi:hypothetical protein GI582_20355 [Sulfitobacter sp. BDSS02]|nr:hypothetical protein [Sulfitobacter sp. BDSS02]MBR9850995.1 pentapeptide repeat-containing protein [Paracoccaceae bacterium]
MSKKLEKQRERLRNRLGSSEINFARQEASIKQANETTRTAKGIWFGLLAYMAFVGVTLMGLDDVDFFIPERQTTLPLVNVAVPTFLFMAIAPCLGALVYAYFHMHLMKHWEALAKLPARFQGDPISNHIAPWLVSDFALARRQDGAIPPRPLRDETNWINISLAFVGTPALLLVFWWRSTVPQYEWLTLFVNGGSFLLSVFMGLVSWKRLATLMEDDKAVPRRLSKRTLKAFAIVAFLITLAGWFRTEGSLAQYAREIGISEETVETNKIFYAPFPNLVAKAHLEGENFSKVPPEWLTPEQDRISYRPVWCEERGLPPSVCGKPISNGEWPTRVLFLEREQYCTKLVGANPEGFDCQSFFAEHEHDFTEDWQTLWNLKMNKIQRFNFSGADLKYANLRSSQLQRANLEKPQLQGANFHLTQLQKSYLREAQLRGANLLLAQMQGADLQSAHLQNARLEETQLQRANLTGAEMQNTNLRKSLLQGAILDKTQLQGADLSEAQFDASSSFNAANLRGAALRKVDFTMIPDFPVDLGEVFGDSTVKFPESVDVPERFNRSYASDDEFIAAWRAFQKEIGFDPDDPSTWDKRKD